MSHIEQNITAMLVDLKKSYIFFIGFEAKIILRLVCFNWNYPLNFLVKVT